VCVCVCVNVLGSVEPARASTRSALARGCMLPH